MDHYSTINKTASAEFKDRGSKFIAYAYPLAGADCFKKYLQALKKEHAKAVHHCFAYRLGVTGDNFRASDDGEPSGTAGKPILGQIDSKKLTDTAIIVVRYFGGTLLGTPGLINAYKTATSLVLQMVPVMQKQIIIAYSIEFNYTRMNDVMQVIKHYNCTIVANEIQLFPVIQIGIPQSRLGEVLYKLKEMRNVEVKRLL